MIAVSATLVGVGLWSRSKRAEEPAAIADALLGRILEFDSRAVYEGASAEERRSCGLTPERMDRVMAELIKPRLEPFSILGERHVEPPGADQVVWANVSVGNPAGFELPLSVELAPDSSGTWASSYTKPLFAAWVADWMTTTGRVIDHRGDAEALLFGLRKDRAKLEEIGLSGMASLGSNPTVVTWAEFQAQLEGYMARRERIRAKVADRA